MISERQFAQEFHGFWRECLPLLTPHFVHLFNEGFREVLFDRVGLAAREVSSAESNDPSLVAEVAFHLAKLAYERQVDLRDAPHETMLIEEAEANAVRAIRGYEKDRIHEMVVRAEERAEALMLLQNYDALLSTFSGVEIQFSPRIRGAGIVNMCMADLSVGNTLFEIKTVKRSIAGKDIRQLLVYLALQAAAGQRRWNEAGFFNPREGCIYLFSVDTFIPLISGGRLSVEVFDDIIQIMSTSDVQIDAPF